MSVKAAKPDESLMSGHCETPLQLQVLQPAINQADRKYLAGFEVLQTTG